MSYRRSDLQEAFFVPGTHAFRVWGYGTADALHDVLAPGYFSAAGAQLQPGDLVYARAGALDERLPGAAAAGLRMALLMVRSGSRGSVSVRLVQDFGRTDEPDPIEPARHALPPAASAIPEMPAAAAQAAPAKRGRGRPPGSRNRKNGALATTALN